MSTRTWPFKVTEVSRPSAATVVVSAPAVTLTGGSPNRCACAAVRKFSLWPLAVMVTEPSAWVVSFPGPDTFSVMAFPVLRFVYVDLREPVTRVITDPSEALSSLAYSLATAKVTRILNPQNDGGTVNGLGCRSSHLWPRPARAGDAVSTPVNMPSAAASATITPIRLMMITPPHSPRPPGCGQCQALFSRLPAGDSQRPPQGPRLARTLAKPWHGLDVTRRVYRFTVQKPFA